MTLLTVHTQQPKNSILLPSEYYHEQMTMGDLISLLRSMPPDAQVSNLTNFHSARANYCDLALELDDGLRPASELLKLATKACRSTFTGYKGGIFKMNKLTPIWIARYGETGEELVAVIEGGIVITKPWE